MQKTTYRFHAKFLISAAGIILDPSFTSAGCNDVLLAAAVAAFLIHRRRHGFVMEIALRSLAHVNLQKRQSSRWGIGLQLLLLLLLLLLLVHLLLAVVFRENGSLLNEMYIPINSKHNHISFKQQEMSVPSNGADEGTDLSPITFKATAFNMIDQYEAD